MRKVIGAAVVAATIGLASTTPAQEPVAGKSAAGPGRSIPYKQEEDLAGQLARVGIGLVLALGAGVAGLYGYKRYLGRYLSPTGRRMRVVETLRLTPKTSLFLVELDGKTLLISQVGDALAVLDRKAPGDDA